MTPKEVLAIQKYINKHTKNISIKEDGVWQRHTHQSYITFQMYQGIQHFKQIPKNVKDIQHEGMRKFVELCLSNDAELNSDNSISDTPAEIETTLTQGLTNNPHQINVKPDTGPIVIQLKKPENKTDGFNTTTNKNTQPIKNSLPVPNFEQRVSNDKLQAKNLKILNELFRK